MFDQPSADDGSDSMKKGIFYVLLLIVVFGTGTFIIEKTSSASAAAKLAITKSNDVLHDIGPVKYLWLTMLSNKTGPSGKGCSTLSYLAIGTRGSEWVHVQLTVARYGAPWTVSEIAQGSASPQSVCVYG